MRYKNAIVTFIFALTLHLAAHSAFAQDLSVASAANAAAATTIATPTAAANTPTTAAPTAAAPTAAAPTAAAPTAAALDAISNQAILERIDQNVFTDARKSLSRMIVYNRRGRKREMKMRSWVVGSTKAFSEYLAPRKEKGTKMLKAGKNIWTYSPRADRVIHIAGHLLRQPIMGSDLSYEDSLEETELSKDYETLERQDDTLENRPVWVMKLQARRDDVAYAIKKLWVDKERFIPLRQEWFGKSGKLLKRATIKETKKLAGRWYPTSMLFKDVLKRGKGTEFIIDEIEFNPKMPSRIFSKQSLRR